MPGRPRNFPELTFRRDRPVRTLWNLFHGHRRTMGLAVLFFIIKHSPAWVMPIVTGSIINALTSAMANNGQFATEIIIVNAFIMVVLIAQNVPSHTLYTWFLSKSVRQVQLQLRSALVVRLQQLSISFHDEHQAGRMQSKVLRDVEAVENLSKQIIQTVLSGMIGVAIALGVTLSKQPKVAMFFFLTVPVAVLLPRFFRNRMSERNKAFRQELESMSAMVSEMIDMIPVTRAHAAEEHEVDRLHRQLLRIRKTGQQLDVTNELFASSAWATFQTFQLVCLLFTVYLAYRRVIPVGDVVMYQGFFGMIVSAVSGVLMVYPQMMQGFESIRSIGEVLESPDIEVNAGKKPVAAVQGRITFDHVTFTYAGTDRAAIGDFSLDVPPGQCVAFVGESGSGKSTLMNLVIGFRRPTSGRILLDGVDMAGLDLRTFRKHIAVVPQQTLLFSGTVRENITYGLQGFDEGRLKEVLDAANASEFIARLPQGLETRVGSHGSKLSGGQRQRIAIARALLRDPRIIILDEATSALDVISEHLVQEAINRLIQGRTTFIVAHRLSTIRHAHKIVVMGRGQTVETGTHDELLKAEGAFWQLHALQV